MCKKAVDILDLRKLDKTEQRKLEQWLERCKRDLEAQLKDLDRGLDKIRKERRRATGAPSRG